MKKASAVDLGGLYELGRHVLEARDVDDHHVAHELPVHQHDQARQAQAPVVGDGLAPVLEDGVEHGLPGVAQDQTANEVGHEEDGPEEVGAAQPARAV